MCTNENNYVLLILVQNLIHFFFRWWHDSGYMAPEYVKSGYFSTKSDVYSFGVLVLEIVAGRKNSSLHNSLNLQNLVRK